MAGVRPKDKLLVAVSGGVDSMALLEVMRKLNYPVTVGHVNHGLRKTAGRDERLVEEYCRKWKTDYLVKKVNLGRKQTGIEERAREARYKALRQMLKEANAKWIVTAHTADDQVETIAGNWLRGSLTRGLGGMRLMSGEVIRPLLGVWKKELMVYAKQHRLKYAVDETNADTKFTRNRIRLQLLPVLRKFNPKLDEQLAANAKLWQETEQALRELARQYFKTLAKVDQRKVTLTVSRLNELTAVMRGEIIKLAVQAVGQDWVDLKKAHLDELMKIAASRELRVAKRRLGGKLFCSKAYGKITISQE